MFARCLLESAPKPIDLLVRGPVAHAETHPQGYDAPLIDADSCEGLDALQMTALRALPISGPIGRVHAEDLTPLSDLMHE
jgi:hypothetical protein